MYPKLLSHVARVSSWVMVVLASVVTLALARVIVRRDRYEASSFALSGIWLGALALLFVVMPIAFLFIFTKRRNDWSSLKLATWSFLLMVFDAFAMLLVPVREGMTD